MLYFAYGSNLNVGQMHQRCPRARALAKATLQDYAMVFRGSHRRGYGVANVESDKGSTVIGGLWQITERCLESLDVYEGYPTLYDRKFLPVQIENGKEVMALVYVMQPGYELALPAKPYYKTIAEGFVCFGLDQQKLCDAVKLTKKLQRMVSCF